MRYLIYLMILVALVVAATLAAQVYLSEPLTIQYRGWVAAPPLVLALGATLLGLLLLFFLLRLFIALIFLPLTVSRWRNRRRGQKELQLRKDILRESVYENQRAQTKLLAELAATDAAAAWRAAQVAEESGDTKNVKNYLQLAESGGDTVIRTAAIAKRCMREQRLSEADTVLTAAGAPSGATLLVKLYYDLCLLRADWRGAMAAAIKLRSESAQLYGNYVETALQRFLQQAKNAAEVADLWKNAVTPVDKKEPALVAKYLTALWRLGNEKAATEELTTALKQHPKHIAILQAVVRFGSPAQQETAFLANEKAADNANVVDAERLQLLTELAEQLQLPGKVRQYSQMLSALRGKTANG